jgi:formate hydrogenlyase subunit 6/NADH:ubiquinone oxidoreductase subunit I
MKKPKLRELREAVKSLFSRPYTEKALLKTAPGFRGQARYFDEDCIGCRACAEVCPANCIVVEDDLRHDPPVRRLTVKTDQCIFCGQCEYYCTTKKGIRLTEIYDLATFTPRDPRVVVEKPLLLCERCGDVIGCVDHLRWIGHRIGAKAYANPTLLLVMAPGAESTANVRTGPLPDRSDIMRALCTSCRRQILAAEVWG